MTLGAQIVDLSGLDLGNDVHEIGAVAEITIVKLELIGAWRENEVKWGRLIEMTLTLTFVLILSQHQ